MQTVPSLYFKGFNQERGIYGEGNCLESIGVFTIARKTSRLTNKESTRISRKTVSFISSKCNTNSYRSILIMVKVNPNASNMNLKCDGHVQ